MSGDSGKGRYAIIAETRRVWSRGNGSEVPGLEDRGVSNLHLKDRSIPMSEKSISHCGSA